MRPARPGKNRMLRCLSFESEKWLSRLELNQHLRRSRRRASASWATRSDNEKSRRQDLHLHWTRSELVASALGYAVKTREVGPEAGPGAPRGRNRINLRENIGKWRPRTDLHPQPSDSKAGALADSATGLGNGMDEGNGALASAGEPAFASKQAAETSAPSSEVGLTNGTCTRTAAFTGPDATVTL